MGTCEQVCSEKRVYVRSWMPIPDYALAAIGADERGFLSDKPVQRPDGIWNFSRGSEPV